jgi:hypothetical protein
MDEKDENKKWVEKGFYDPNAVYPKYKDEVDTNRLAVNEPTQPHLGLELRKLTRKTGIATADFDEVPSDKFVADTTIAASDGDTWDQPTIPYAAIYPYNHVFESESGHIFEIDDTKDNERLFNSHRTGTSTEINAEGTLVNIIKKDSYAIVAGLSQASISGKSDITIGGRHKIYINKDGQEGNNYDIQIGPNANVNIQVDKGDMNVVLANGKMNTKVNGDYNLDIDGNYTIDVKGNRNIYVNGTTVDETKESVTHKAGPNYKVLATRIDLNP